MNEINLKDFLAIGEAAAIVGVSLETLRRWDRSGKLQAVKHPISNHRLYRREDLQTFLRSVTDQHPNLSSASDPRKETSEE